MLNPIENSEPPPWYTVLFARIQEEARKSNSNSIKIQCTQNKNYRHDKENSLLLIFYELNILWYKIYRHLVCSSFSSLFPSYKYFSFFKIFILNFVRKIVWNFMAHWEHKFFFFPSFSSFFPCYWIAYI